MVNNKRRISKRKSINPKFWVFCEGKTEKSYVEVVGVTKQKYFVVTVPL